MEIQVWQVYHLWCHYTLPNPKYKYVVIVSVEPYLWGFMINSRMNALTAACPELVACNVPLAATQHPFLDHDSFIDCTTLCSFSENELVNLKGQINAAVQSELIKTVRVCEELSPRHKRMILAQLTKP